MDIQIAATLGMIIFCGLIIAAVMKNSVIGMLAGLISGGAILILIYILIQSDSTYQIKRGD
jgi:hypothetical protein